jgi:hypothetical protein
VLVRLLGAPPTGGTHLESNGPVLGGRSANGGGNGGGGVSVNPRGPPNTGDSPMALAAACRVEPSVERSFLATELVLFRCSGVQVLAGRLDDTWYPRCGLKRQNMALWASIGGPT